MNEFDSLIIGLVRACQPVTIRQVIAELQTHSPAWSGMMSLDRNEVISGSINTLIALGKIRIDIDAANGQVTLDLPHDAPPDRAGEFLQRVGRSMARRQAQAKAAE